MTVKDDFLEFIATLPKEEVSTLRNHCFPEHLELLHAEIRKRNDEELKAHRQKERGTIDRNS